MKLSPWARNALSPEALSVALAARIHVVGRSPKGPWTAWREDGPRVQSGDVNVAVLRAANRAT